MKPAKRPACDNEDHRGLPTAVARLSWPDGRFRPVLACLSCLRWQVRYSVDGTHGTTHAVLVSPLECEPHGWARLIEDGHRLEDVVRADAMHTGGTP
jgi:hypothetical protein